ncbi:MAG: amidohydrolase family protein [Acidimicrobiia bacterium]|nr:amidohydrolase family protein [Acidimicrobiia bacterium]
MVMAAGNAPDEVLGATNTATLRNARLADGRLVDLTVPGGRIAAVAPAAGTSPAATGPAATGDVDLQGWLVLPAMAEPHAHLDKALTAELVPNPTGDLLGAIDAWVAAAAAGRFTHEGTVARATAALELLAVHGVTAVRSHVNVTADVGARSVVAVREAAAAFEGLIDVQLVALCGTPLVGPEGAPTRAALAEALAAGVDLVGGCPHLDENGDGPGVIKICLDAAREAGLPVDLHVDETLDAGVLTLRHLARAVVDRGFDLPVTASHCVSLGVQPPAVQAAVAAEVASAGISVVPLPQTNLFLQGRDHPAATPRGLTAIAALRQAGVVVAAGGDNVQDPFNLVGRSDPLETASLLVMAAHQLPDDAYDLVSNQVRRALGLEPVTFAVGDPADLVAIDAPSVRAAIADAPRSRRVFRRGRLVASCDQQLRLHR